MKKFFALTLMAQLLSCVSFASTDRIEVTLLNKTKESVELRKSTKTTTDSFRVEYRLDGRNIRSKVITRSVYERLLKDYQPIYAAVIHRSRPADITSCSSRVQFSRVSADQPPLVSVACGDKWSERESMRFAAWYKAAAKWAF